jgi:SAM-dependent methyltransferase
MLIWNLIKRLVADRSTLARALGEIELSQLIDDTMILRRHLSTILVAGGGRRSRGSESLLIEALEGTAKLIRVDIDHAKNPDIEADFTVTWPFKQGTFDLIVSTWVVEHLASPERFFEEAFRVLSDDGVLICGVPFIYRMHGSPADYWRFTDIALSYLARSVGFRIVEVRSVGSTPCISCLSLLWPFFKVRFIGILFVMLAYGVDSAIRLTCQLTGKGRTLIHSYPIHFIAYARK